MAKKGMNTREESRTYHRYHRPRRRLPCGIASTKRSSVHRIKRRTSQFNTARIDHLYHDPHEQGVDLTLHHGNRYVKLGSNHAARSAG